MDDKTLAQEVKSALHSRIPRWPAIVALLVIAGAYWGLSEALKPVSRELLGGVVVAGIVLVSLEAVMNLLRGSLLMRKTGDRWGIELSE